MDKIVLFDPSGRPFPEPTVPRQAALAPIDEVAQIIREATQTVEDELRLEDEGWINLSGQTGAVITDMERINNLKLSRLFFKRIRSN